MPIAIIIAILLAGGVSIGANHSLPGDALYGVKTHVNENIENAFSFSDEAKARTAEKHADARLTEAEKLSAEGKLTDDERASLTASFMADADAVNRSKANLTANGNTEAASKIDSDFKADLQNHLGMLQSGGSMTAALAVTVSGAMSASGNGAASATMTGSSNSDMSASSTNDANANMNAGVNASVNTKTNASSSSSGSSASGSGLLNINY